MGKTSLLDESSGRMSERHGCYADHSVSIGQMVFGTKERRGRGVSGNVKHGPANYSASNPALHCAGWLKVDASVGKHVGKIGLVIPAIMSIPLCRQRLLLINTRGSFHTLETD